MWFLSVRELARLDWTLFLPATTLNAPAIFLVEKVTYYYRMFRKEDQSF